MTTCENRHIQASRASHRGPYRQLATHPAEPAPLDACQCWLRIEPLLEPFRGIPDALRGRQFSDCIRGSCRARPFRRQDEALPLSTASGTTVRNIDQFKPRVGAAGYIHARGGRRRAQKLGANDIAWKSKPSWYVLATRDHTVHPDLQRWVSKRMGATVTEVESSHVPMLSHPDIVIDVIRKAAAVVK